jgi:uncharacterized protein (TIGR02246 family)
VSVTDAVLTKDEAAVLKGVQRVIDAWADNDANAFAECHGKDATIVTVEGLYCKGREAMRGLMTNLYAGPFKGSKVFWKLEDIRFVTDDVAIVIYWNGILLGGVKELPPEETRRATSVMSRQDNGEWLIEAFQNVFITEPATEAVPS